ncbi:pyridoxal phosphate-dependent transferase [Schizophyllum commune]
MLRATTKSVLSGVARQSTRSASTYGALHDFGTKHVNKGVGRLVPGIMEKGEGSYVTYEDGRKMLDFTCGIGVTNLGHCHPKVSQAAAEQCLKIVHAQNSISFHRPYLELIERLLPTMPDPSLDSFFFWNSGSEAIEGALKMARLMTGRKGFICMQGAYHGRTYGAMAVTKSKTIYSEGTGPLMPMVYTTPYPYFHQLGLPPNSSPEEHTRAALHQLHLLFKQAIRPDSVAAIIIEPLLGEGGYVPAPTSYLKALRELCDKHGILLIVDEVQSGFARTGKWWCIEHSGVRPDIMTFAKGLANGFPLSGIVSRKELTDKLKPGCMGGTYAGNAVSCAASIAVCDAIKEEKVLENVEARSKQLFATLNSLKSDPEVGKYLLDVRGQGLMAAIEFARPPKDIEIDLATDGVEGCPSNFAARVGKKCIEKGMLILTTSIYEVLRIIPPLNVSEADMAKGCQIIAEAVKEVAKEG